VTLLSETHLKPHERFYIPNYNVYRTYRFLCIKDGTAFAVRNFIPHNHVDLHPCINRTIGVCIPIRHSELLLAAVYKSPGRAWGDADIIEHLSLRRKSLFAGDLNAKHPFSNSTLSDPSGKKLLDLFGVNDLEISAPQSPTHY
jgi:hypothetical protein